MKHLAAYLLLGLAGNSSPSEDDIKGVLESVGIDADSERLSKLLEELDGKDVNVVCHTHNHTLNFAVYVQNLTVCF
jgi:ribosomal protein L12E/L44/L45/RPP1/RPP2